jgi:hypothetical protein
MLHDERYCLEERASREAHHRGVGVAMPTKSSKRWVANVHTDSTHPPTGLFTKSATTIARELASKRVSPKGPSSGMRMLNYFINRAGRGLSARRKATLERAKTLLSQRIAAQRKKKVSKKG